MELGIYTFGDRYFDPATGQYSSAQQRTLAQMDVGGVPHRNFMKSIELFGTEVAPAVRKALAGKV